VAASTGSGYWTTTVADCIRDFREAILALIPLLERQRIPWTLASAYDDWDELVSTLYATFVTNNLRNNEGIDAQLAIASYDMQRDDWSDVSFIATIAAPGQGGYQAFEALDDDAAAFSRAMLCPLDDSYRRRGDSFSVPLDGLEFVFIELGADGSRREHRDLRVIL